MPKFLFFPASGFDFGNALKFDGINDSVTCGNISLGAASITSITFAFYAKRTSTPTSNIEYYFTSGNSLTNRLIVQDRQSVSYRINIDSAYIEYNTYITDLDWHHFVIVYDGTLLGSNKLKMYIDGTLLTVSATSGTIPSTISSNSLENLVIGSNTASISGTFRYTSAILDEFVIWPNVAATSTNVSDLYNSGSYILATDVISSPERYYQLNSSGTDTVAIDSSGNNNNGTLNNFTGTYWVAH